MGIEDETRKFRSQEEELLRLKEELDKLKQNLKTLNDNLKSENINKNTLLQVSSLAFLQVSSLAFRLLIDWTDFLCFDHREDRVLSFSSSRWNWGSPPSPADECAPQPFGSGGGTHSLAGEGGSQFQQGDIHCGTLGLYVHGGYNIITH